MSSWIKRCRAPGLAVLAALVVSACAPAGIGPTARTFDAGVNLPQEVVRGWRVARVDVVVPEILTVSEDPGTRFPGTDLTWWEDPEGDRRAQIAEVLRGAVTRAVDDLDGGEPVTVQLSVNWFHALTPKARGSGNYGWHDINFDLAIIDQHGRVLAEESSIDADLNAFQGERAKKAVAEGLTQKVRIRLRVRRVLRAWLGLI